MSDDEFDIENDDQVSALFEQELILDRNIV
jgi:hypothetical protein